MIHTLLFQQAMALVEEARRRWLAGWWSLAAGSPVFLDLSTGRPPLIQGMLSVPEFVLEHWPGKYMFPTFSRCSCRRNPWRFLLYGSTYLYSVRPSECPQDWQRAILWTTSFRVTIGDPNRGCACAVILESSVTHLRKQACTCCPCHCYNLCCLKLKTPLSL